MVILFFSNTKEAGGSQPRETLSFGERSGLLLKATAVINEDDVISKFLGRPGIPRAKETGSQSTKPVNTHLPNGV